MKSIKANKSGESLSAISLMAALADGAIRDAERIHVNSAMTDLSDQERQCVYERVVRKLTSLHSEVLYLQSRELHVRALRIARLICEADGQISETEQRFLQRLEALGALTADTGIRRRG